MGQMISDGNWTNWGEKQPSKLIWSQNNTIGLEPSVPASLAQVLPQCIYSYVEYLLNVNINRSIAMTADLLTGQSITPSSASCSFDPKIVCV